MTRTILNFRAGRTFPTPDLYGERCMIRIVLLTIQSSLVYSVYFFAIWTILHHSSALFPDHLAFVVVVALKQAYKQTTVLVVKKSE